MKASLAVTGSSYRLIAVTEQASYNNQNLKNYENFILFSKPHLRFIGNPDNSEQLARFVDFHNLGLLLLAAKPCTPVCENVPVVISSRCGPILRLVSSAILL